MPVYILALLYLAISPAMADEDVYTSDIQLNISGIHAEQGGPLVVLLYDQSGWLEEEKAVRRLVLPLNERGAIKVSLPDIPYPEVYAVQVYQDVNNNHKLDMHWFPLPGPDEPYGFSNHYIPFAKPSFKKASFRFHAPDQVIDISLHP